MLPIVAFVAGFVTAGFWVAYIKATAAGKAAGAAAADLAISLASSGVVQLWAVAGQRFEVLAAWDLGGVLGTYLLVRFGKRERNV